MALQPLSPATARRPDGERKRIPMSTPVQKLEAPDIPGFHLHWFRSEPDRIARAQAAGYTFVDEQETAVNSVGLGNSSTRSGNTDLGSQVSVIAGGIGKDGQPSRLILMKIPLEFYEEDQKIVANRNDQVADSILGGLAGNAGNPGDTSHQYLKKDLTRIPDIFNRHKAKRPGAPR